MNQWPAEVPCKNCNGTGHKGTFGCYPMVCRACGGEGTVLIVYKAKLVRA
jgi:DnaJ-class molecular chaperone